MYNFDIEKQGFEHRFVKSNSGMLNNFYGTDDVVPFWVADMDFEIAQPIKDELQRLVDRNIYAYEMDKNKVYDAIVKWFANRHLLSLQSENFVQVSGVLTGVALLVRELSAVGDGVLIQTPIYHQFSQIISKADRKIVSSPLRYEDGAYTMDFDDMEAKFKRDDVTLMILCNPHNPVGRVWTKDELQQVTSLANRYNVTIISDEIHSDIIYAGHTFNSIMSVDAENHIALIGSPAKTFGMQSISNGYMYIPNKAMHQQIEQVVGAMYLDHGNAFSTYATIAAFEHGSQWLDEFTAYMAANVAWIKDFVETEMPGVKLVPVEGTYQVWLDFSGLCLSDEGLAHLVFKQAKLGLTPGQWFGEGAQQFMRMNIASPLSKIQAAYESLANATKMKNVPFQITGVSSCSGKSCC